MGYGDRLERCAARRSVCDRWRDERRRAHAHGRQGVTSPSTSILYEGTQAFVRQDRLVAHTLRAVGVCWKAPFTTARAWEDVPRMLPRSESTKAMRMVERGAQVRRQDRVGCVCLRSPGEPWSRGTSVGAFIYRKDAPRSAVELFDS